MSIKPLIVCLAAFTLGVICTNAYRVVTAYYRLPGIWNQGEELVSKIEEYKTNHGGYPPGSWFYESIDEVKTIEGRSWVYLKPPVKNNEGKDILIFTRVDYGDAYHGVCSGGDIRRIELESLINNPSEQAASSNR